MVPFDNCKFRSNAGDAVEWLSRSRQRADRMWASLGQPLFPRVILKLALFALFLMALPTGLANATRTISLALPRLAPPGKGSSAVGYGNGPCGLPTGAFSPSYRSPVPVKNKWVSIGEAFHSPIMVYVGPPFGKNKVGPAISARRLRPRAIASIVRIYVRHYAPGTSICGKNFCERLEIYCRYFVTAAGIKTALLRSINKGTDAVVLPAIIHWYEERKNRPAEVYPGYEGRVYPSLAVANWALKLNRDKPPEFATFWKQGLILARMTQAAHEIEKHEDGFAADRPMLPEIAAKNPEGWLSKRETRQVRNFIASSKTAIARSILRDMTQRKTLIKDGVLRTLIRRRLEHIVEGGTRSPVNGSPAQP